MTFQYRKAVPSKAMPGITIASLQPKAGSATKVMTTAKIRGIAIWVTPPPRLPQPAVVAFAVPTVFGANITDVWYWVITNDAPMAPIASRNSKNVS